jgi:chemotaxis protein CheX
MNEKDVKAIIDATTSYFEQYGTVHAQVGVPYIKGDKTILLDYTGIIGISGIRKGVIYITTTKKMLEELIKAVSGIQSFGTAEIIDMSGELANTISGNIQKVFGSHFMISAPSVVQGKPNDITIHLTNPTYIIPVTWNSEEFFITISLE